MSVGEITRHQIQRSAEQLFAARGFHGTSVREITAAAGVDGALLNYHFVGKSELFEHIVSQLVMGLIEEQTSAIRIAAVSDVGRGEACHSLAIAVVAPLLCCAADKDDGKRSGVRLYSRLVADADPLPPTFVAQMRSQAAQFAARLSLVAPHQPPRLLARCHAMTLRTGLVAAVELLAVAPRRRVIAHNDALRTAVCYAAAGIAALIA